MGVFVFYVFGFIFSALIVMTIVSLWILTELTIFILTALAMLIGSKWRPIRRRQAKVSPRPIPQARYSNRR